jgi:hypothetical protein
MSNVKLRKSWKITETLLERARRALPASFAAHEQQYAALLIQYGEFVAHNEFELALNVLEELGDLVSCRGGFWRNLERAAENMSLVEKLPNLRKRFSEALQESTGSLQLPKP